ncbi:MAG: hypothetical protein F4103_11430, partial [Boseongicola sp. SB0673_bin_14]|nr:hypothetical protein [Boseongicola sp. SB0673_bin_14]
MTSGTQSPGGTDRLFAVLSTLACILLGAIALYSSGVGLVEPKFHRAAGFALALLAGIAASRARRNPEGSVAGARAAVNLTMDMALMAAGLWAIWSFHYVQLRMEVALYDVTQADAWPALAGLVVFLVLCRRLWGWGLFGVGAFGVLYLLFGKDLPGILAHTGFTLKEVAEALWYNTNKGVFGSIMSTAFQKGGISAVGRAFER